MYRVLLPDGAITQLPSGRLQVPSQRTRIQPQTPISLTSSQSCSVVTSSFSLPTTASPQVLKSLLNHHLEPLSNFLSPSPPDLLLLRTPEKGGAVFIRTDQLDGETGAPHVQNQPVSSSNIARLDWKLKHAPSQTQNLSHDQQLTSRGRSDKSFAVQAEPPSLEIYKFSGLLTCGGGSGDAERDHDTSCVESSTGSAASVEQESLSIENVLWCNTVLCSSAAVGCVLYTGENIHTHMHTFMYSSRALQRQRFERLCNFLNCV